MRYMVLECHPGYAVVLDEEGRFLKVANLRYKVGQTVSDVVEMKPPQPTAVQKRRNRWLGPLVAAAACLALVVTSVLQISQPPYASVYMAINPEVRIDVNRRDMVVGLEGINADGQDLIHGYRHKKKDLELVMDELVDRAIHMGYLHRGGKITLTLDAESEAWIVYHGDALTSQLQEHLEGRLSVTIEVSGRTSAQHSVTIPVAPGRSGYGEDDYGASEPSGGDAGNAPQELSGKPGETPPPHGDGETDYSPDDDPEQEDGQTDYGPVDDGGGQSAYGDDPDGGPDDDGQSAYGEAPEDIPAPDDDGLSAYGKFPEEIPAPEDDGQSAYGKFPEEIPAPEDDGQTSYEAPAGSGAQDGGWGPDNGRDDGPDDAAAPDDTDGDGEWPEREEPPDGGDDGASDDD